jgi:hypothetical protein
MSGSPNKEQYVERLCDAIVDSMDRKTLEIAVWDHIFEELITQDWVDLRMIGQDYGIETES